MAPSRPERPRGKPNSEPLFLKARLANSEVRLADPAVTAEQVCRALNHRCAVAFRRRRGVPEVRHTSDVIRYHQRRNAQAAKSHKKQRHKCVL